MSTSLAHVTGAVRTHTWRPASPCHLVFSIDTSRPTEFVDLTERVRTFVAATGVDMGLLIVQSLHTTLAVVVNEHEPLLLGDFVRHLERWAPADGSYAHDDPARRRVNVQPSERTNGHAHCRALALGVSVTLGIAGGEVLLGRWQRVLAVELDGPQSRLVALTVVGDRS